MSDLSLFPEREPPADAAAGNAAPEASTDAPLAARMRPRTLEEFRGQEHVLGHGKALRSMIEQGDPGSMILWGPPGSGKTTLARLVADRTDAAFVAFSAVTEGVARVREVIKEAKERRRATNRSTILFCDEIHRFNKAQQDAFLPHVESGTVVLIGATTENPSFEVVRPLLSRAPVFTLKPSLSRRCRGYPSLGAGRRGARPGPPGARSGLRRPRGHGSGCRRRRPEGTGHLGDGRQAGRGPRHRGPIEGGGGRTASVCPIR